MRHCEHGVGVRGLLLEVLSFRDGFWDLATDLACMASVFTCSAIMLAPSRFTGNPSHVTRTVVWFIVTSKWNCDCCHMSQQGTYWMCSLLFWLYEFFCLWVQSEEFIVWKVHKRDSHISKNMRGGLVLTSQWYQLLGLKISVTTPGLKHIFIAILFSYILF